MLNCCNGLQVDYNEEKEVKKESKNSSEDEVQEVREDGKDDLLVLPVEPTGLEVDWKPI